MEQNLLQQLTTTTDDDVASVPLYRDVLEKLLAFAATIKPEQAIEPPLPTAELGERIRMIYENEPLPAKENKQAHYAAIETAFRDKFYGLIAATAIDDPAFSQVWNLLDILSIFSDNEQCEPGLIFWLIEELLDSQTIDGCRKVFDYLESRRERITTKHFKQKSLIILRSCNELLRRLSRAEDTVFCGRVFIFLFQSFPLGDKSSVNLRGEYHTENVTTFDDIAAKPAKPEGSMDVDTPDQKGALEVTQIEQDTKKTDKEAASTAGQSQDNTSAPTLEVTEAKPDTEVPLLDIDALYPIFWSLQENFSAPTRLFTQENFESFQKGLEATIQTFQKVNTQFEARGPFKNSDDSKRGTKRKRTGDGEEAGSSFNPKYLTSRDLFELEINDVAFRRHILVQALILLDFLLSLTTRSKSKLTDMTNKSVLYTHSLKDEDAKWATQTKIAIANYLQLGTEGKFYYRMVDTVLSRDRNWVRWKAQGCPPFEEKPVSLEQFQNALDNAQKACTNKRLRSTPLGSLNLQFLSQEEGSTSLDRLKNPDRSSKPSVESLLKGIANDELDIDMAKTDEDKNVPISSKGSKTWKTLRIASKSKLNLFDKVDDGKNLTILIEAPPEAKVEEHLENGAISEKPAEIQVKENVKAPVDTAAESATSTEPSFTAAEVTVE